MGESRPSRLGQPRTFRSVEKFGLVAGLPRLNTLGPRKEAHHGIAGLEPIEPLLDVTKAAHLLGISVKTLRDWIQGRRIDYVKVGARVMIRPETIRQFVTNNTRRAAG
jgi:excisionase family DNA binding protein